VVEVSLPKNDWQLLARTLDEERGEPVPGDIGKPEIGELPYLIRRREGAMNGEAASAEFVARNGRGL
jgi:hypothetical protein